MPNDRATVPRQLVVVGVPESKRVRQLMDATKPWGHPPVMVYTYREAMEGSRVPPEHSLVRFESPSDCPETLKVILTAGIEPMVVDRLVPLAKGDVGQLEPGRGEILHPRQWFLGFRGVLRSIETRWRDLSLQWMSNPESIITSFDKIACLERWERVGLPVPPRIAGVSTYSAIRQHVSEHHARLFIKLRYGYSAMGAVALEWRGGLVRAITTVEVVWSEGRPRLYVTKRPRVLTREFEIAWLIDTLAMEEVIVERWLPKARWDGRPYDLRIVMIGGRVRHVVGRSSSSPFTNLNLDARRIAREEIVSNLGTVWPELQSLAERAAEQIPGAGMLGLDALVRPRNQGFVLLEANAFGDYLPGLLHEGDTTYAAQFREVYGRPTEVCS